jgi:hypothetical protein
MIVDLAEEQSITVNLAVGATDNSGYGSGSNRQ